VIEVWILFSLWWALAVCVVVWYRRLVRVVDVHAERLGDELERQNVTNRERSGALADHVDRIQRLERALQAAHLRARNAEALAEHTRARTVGLETQLVALKVALKATGERL